MTEEDEERLRLRGEDEEEEEESKKRRCLLCIPCLCCCRTMTRVIILVVVLVLIIICVISVLLALFLRVNDTSTCAHIVRNCTVFEDVTKVKGRSCKSSGNSANFNLSSYPDTSWYECADYCCSDGRCRLFVLEGKLCRLLSSCPVEIKVDNAIIYKPNHYQIENIKEGCEFSRSQTGIRTESTSSAVKEETHIDRVATKAASVTKVTSPHRNEDILLQYRLDLVIFLDGTGYTSRSLFDAVKNYIIETATKFDLLPEWTRIYVIYIGEDVTFIESFDGFAKVKLMTGEKKMVPKPKDIKQFISEVTQLQYTGIKTEKPSPQFFLEALNELMGDDRYRRGDIENVHVLWFAQHDADTLNGISQAINQLVNIKFRKFKWLIKSWARLDFGTLQKAFPNSVIVQNVDKGDSEITAVTKFGTNVLNFLKLSVTIVHKQQYIKRVRKCPAMMELVKNACLIVCPAPLTRDPENPRKCIPQTVTSVCPQHTVKINNKCWNDCPAGTVREPHDPAACRKVEKEQVMSSVSVRMGCPDGYDEVDGKCLLETTNNREDRDLFI